MNRLFHCILGEKGAGRDSIRTARLIFFGVIGILTLTALYLSFFVKFPDRFEPIRFSAFPKGIVTPTDFISPYGQEPESFLVITPDEDARNEKYLRLRIDSKHDDWWGINIGVNHTIPPNALLKMDWRGGGEIQELIIDLKDGKGENFYTFVNAPGEEWSTVTIPLADLISNPFQQPDITPTGIMQHENVQGINITFFPNTDATLDTRHVEFVYRSDQWSYPIVIFGLLVFGLLLLRRTESISLGTGAEWNLRSGPMYTRLSYVLYISSVLIATAGREGDLFTLTSVIVYSAFFCFIVLDEFKKNFFSANQIWLWRYMLVLTAGWYMGFSANWFQMVCLLGIALLPMIRFRTHRYSLTLPAAALIAAAAHPAFNPAVILPPATAVIGTLTIVIVLIRQLISNAEVQRESRYSILLYEQALEHSSEAILTLDMDGKIQRVNKVFESMTGYGAAESIGRVFVDFLHPDDRSLLDPEKRAACGKASRLIDLRLMNREGENRYLLVREIPLCKQGTGIGYQIIGTDVTERRVLEHQLYQTQRLDSLGAVAGGVAHDFNNILGSILGYASLLKMKVEPEHSFFTPLDRIERSATRAADLTGKLLAFARGGGSEKKPLNLNSIVKETIAILEGSFDKSIAIRTILDESLPAMEGDTGQLQQVLMNICVNARDAMPEGGELLIETSHDTLEEAFVKMHVGTQAYRYVVLSVSDTGIGMDKQTQQRIFDPFFTTKPKGRGIGLGLSMVHGTVKSHGGIIQVYSEPGGGSTFRMYFPASDKAIQEIVPVQRESVNGKGRILVVDDEEFMRSLIKEALEGAGYEVTTAEDGEEAVAVYRTQTDSIDLVILDMIMPKMGGREAFRIMREINPDVRVLLSSGYSEQGAAREVIDQGVAGFLQKPYKSYDLQKKVRETLCGVVK